MQQVSVDRKQVVAPVKLWKQSSGCSKLATAASKQCQLAKNGSKLAEAASKEWPQASGISIQAVAAMKWCHQVRGGKKQAVAASKRWVSNAVAA